MRHKRGFDYGKGKYYFVVKDSPSSITISRSEKPEAVHAYQHYATLGKEVEWLGRWNGKDFEEQDI